MGAAGSIVARISAGPFRVSAMSIISRCLVLALAVVVASPSLAAEPAPAPKTRVETVSLRVTVDAAGKVQTMKPSDPQIAAGLLTVAEAFARRLTFTPARKQGVAVPGETTLSMVIALEPRADGQYGPHLRRATNGPGVIEVGKTVAPKYQQGKENGALVAVAVSLLADGTTDMGTMATERMELRVPSAFAEARYLDAIKTSLRGTRFELDKVDGVGIPERVSVAYRFGGGPKKPKPNEEERRGNSKLPEDVEVPALTAVSLAPGIELAKVDYTAPAKAVATDAAK